MNGSTARLSTSRRRNPPLGRSCSCSMYESNAIVEVSKSEYSYDQYHWWPITLRVNMGDFSSSIRYSRWSEGIARNSKVIAGRIVQIVSIR